MNVTNRRVLLATLTAASVAGAAPAVASAPEARDEVVEVTVALVRQALDLATKIQADLVGSTRTWPTSGHVSPRSGRARQRRQA